VPFTDGVQPRIVPLSVANRKRAAPLDAFWLTTKSASAAVEHGPRRANREPERGSTGSFAPVPL
jgi:hypothetical protein